MIVASAAILGLGPYRYPPEGKAPAEAQRIDRSGGGFATAMLLCMGLFSIFWSGAGLSAWLRHARLQGLGEAASPASPGDVEGWLAWP